MNFITAIRSKNWLIWFIILCLTGLLIALHVRLSQYAYDDAYIHFRVARNLFENGTPYFNPGEMVKVSTSSGWTIFLSLLYATARLFKIDTSFPLLVSIINAMITVCGALVYTAVIESLLKH